MIKCLAFDCFGTVFNMEGVSKAEIKAYGTHVRKSDFSKFHFPSSWWHLQAHPDAAAGIARLRAAGFVCVTLSNGDADLLRSISCAADICWDRVIDLTKHRAYKPHNLAAYKAVEIDTGIPPIQTMMITANPTFGDVESSAAIGMTPQVIRHSGHPADIHELANVLGCS